MTPRLTDMSAAHVAALARMTDERAARVLERAAILVDSTPGLGWREADALSLLMEPAAPVEPRTKWRGR